MDYYCNGATSPTQTTQHSLKILPELKKNDEESYV